MAQVLDVCPLEIFDFVSILFMFWEERNTMDIRRSRLHLWVLLPRLDDSVFSAAED